jgi:hypothetical protein
MFFKKKKGVSCPNCESKVDKKYSFCPYCGTSMLTQESEMRNYGLLGKNDSVDKMEQKFTPTNSILDKVFETAMSSLMKTMEKEMKRSMTQMDNAEITPMPNGIKIRIGPAQPQKKTAAKPKQIKNNITTEQMKRLNSLPKIPAKTNIRRLSDKVLYELATPGLDSAEDVIVSKLEQGYEIKAIGKNKVYVNSIPLELPLKGFFIDSDRLTVEFVSNE